nr:uncharacterized protein LOC129478597 [Symphalangus syndactylus]
MTGSTPSVRALIPEIRSLMLFPAGDKLFGGGVGGMEGEPSAAETRQTPRAAHPLIEADSGRFRADPRCQGADSIPGALLGEGAARAARLDPGLPVPAEDGDPRRLRPPIRIFSSQTSSAYPDPTAHALAPRQESPFLIPKELTLRRDVPSRTVSRSQERSTQQRSADPDFSRGETQRPTLWTFLPTQPGGRRSPAHPETSPPPSWAAARPSCSSLGGLGPFGRTPFSRTSKTGYLVHALQTTLWTCSLLFKSPTRERGKKNPEEIQVNWKKKFQKGVHRGEKSPGSTDLQTTTELSGECGETASHPDLTRNPHTPATLLLFQPERTPTPPPGGPPSWCWAVAEAVHGIPQVATAPPLLLAL